ncbi:MAG TPA: DNA primase [Candidatus Limivivens intestinipullorum]|uniref:DNA primase n=1 Tax=Candidatus Limivivens intestinipullorum TaxID=2840858 RepID=A0A9D1JLT9_9FIRM|nr:DNA primase [Candidatus Limivivens intestinipullorum]
MYYPEELVEEIRERNDIVGVIGSYVRLQRKGSSYFGLCPFHNEKSPSFSVSPDKQMYYCFGCGAGGNVFTFLMEYENFSFQESVKYLADRAGIVLPDREATKEERQAADLKTRILEVNKLAAKYFYYQLWTEPGRQAMEYLKGRQLSDETIKGFGLGFANKYSNDLYRYLKSKGISDELLRDSGLVNVDEKHGMYDKFWNRVIFPIMDVNSRVIGFGGRVMGDGKPKYLNSPETKVFDKSRNLYGLNIARKSRKKYLLVCEGYMDVISMHQAGFQNAVASLGTALTVQHAGLMKRYTGEVILTYDSDEAGVRAALRAIPIVKSAGLSARVLDMRPYKDPDEFIKALGAEAFQERIDQAQNSFLYEISAMEKDYNLKDPEGKTEFFKAAARKLTEFDQELERENYIQAVAEKYHTGFDSLRRLVNRMAMLSPERRPPRTEITEKKKALQDDGMKKSQRLLLTWMIEDKGLYHVLKDWVTPEDFTEPMYREVAAEVFGQLARGEVNPARILNRYPEPEQQREAAALFNTTVHTETVQEREKAVKETLLRVLNHSINRQMAALDPTDIAGMQELINRKRRLRDIQGLHIFSA